MAAEPTLAQRSVMWVREHRQALRVTITSVAVGSFVIVVLVMFAEWSEGSPPPRGDVAASPATPSPSPTSSALALAPPVFESDIAVWSLWPFVLTIVIGAVMRWFITDGKLEQLRHKVGDSRIVTHRRGEELLLRADSDLAEEERESQLNAYLDRLGQGLEDAAEPAIDRLAGANSVELASGTRSMARKWWARAPRSDHPRQSAAADVQRAALRALIAPTSVFTRVTERHVLGDERATVTLSRTIAGSPALGDLLLVPVLRVPKEILVGSLVVLIDGDSGRTVPMSIARGMLIALLRSVTVSAARTVSPPDADRLKNLGLELSRAIASDALTPRAVRAAWIADLNGIHSLPSAPDGYIRWLRALAAIATTTDVVSSSQAVWTARRPGRSRTRRVVRTPRAPSSSKSRRSVVTPVRISTGGTLVGGSMTAIHRRTGERLPSFD